MTRAQEIIERVNNIFADIREKYPQVSDEDLYDSGAIYYMNGNDGTAFDWEVNEHCSEFFIFHKNELGFIKLFVNVGDTYTAYVYPNGEMTSTEKITGKLNKGDSSYLAATLCHQADSKHIYDKPITEIDFSYEPNAWELFYMYKVYGYEGWV